MKGSNNKGDINYYKKYMKYKNKYLTHLHNINQQTKSSNIMIGGCPGCMNPNCAVCFEETRTNNHELVIRCKRCYAYSRNFNQIQHTRDCNNAQAIRLSAIWSDHHLPEPERAINIVPERVRNIVPDPPRLDHNNFPRWSDILPSDSDSDPEPPLLGGQAR